MSATGTDDPLLIRGPVSGPLGLQVPARVLPTPSTVSAQMQKIIGAPLGPNWRRRPETVEQWKSFVDAGAAIATSRIPGLCDRLEVRFEKTTLDGGRAFRVAPASI